MAKNAPTLDALPGSDAPRIFDPRDIPPALQTMPDDFSAYLSGGSRSVRWGWRQWMLMAPELQRHIQKHGRANLAKALTKAQRLLPADQRRTASSITTMASAAAKTPDVLQIVAFLTAQMLRRAQAKPAVPAAKRLALVKPAAARAADPRGVPHAFRTIPPDGLADGIRPGVWGWAQWRAVAPAVWAHLERQGRIGLAAAMSEYQQVLPPEIHRSNWSSRLAPSSPLDIVALVTWLMTEDPARPAANVVPLHPPAAAAPAPAASPVGPIPEVAAVIPPIQDAPQPAAPADPGLQAFLATPIGAFLPGFRAFLKETLQEMLQPNADFISAAVRQAVIDVVGAPAAPVPPPTVSEARAVLEEAVERDLAAPAVVIAEGESEVAPLAGATDDALKALTAKADVTPIVIKAALQKAPHDLETQLALAAKALGVPAPTPRLTIVCVGLHAITEQEVDRFYGRSFRFVFKRPDAFNCVQDVPASADAVLLCRKTLTKELIGMMRRDNLPVAHVQNNSAAVLGALRNLFPDDSDGLYVK